MSFLKEVYPKPDFSSIQSTLINDTPCVIVPQKLLMALKKTPMGLKTLSKFNKCCKDNYRRNKKIMLHITLYEEQLSDLNEPSKITTDHGRTYLKAGFDDITEGVQIDISLFDFGDRMTGWTEDELLSIISIHESEHLKYVKRNKIKFNVTTDECEGFWTRCHFGTFKHEFKARLEYSLLNKSTGKESWLNRYFIMFEIFERFFNSPNENEKKKVREIKKNAKLKTADEQGIDLNDIKSNKINYDYNQEFNNFKDSIISSNNFDNGKNVCIELYNEVIVNFEKRLSWLDGRINKNILNRIKVILKDKQKYLKDDTFVLIF